MNVVVPLTIAQGERISAGVAEAADALFVVGAGLQPGPHRVAHRDSVEPRAERLATFDPLPRFR